MKLIKSDYNTLLKKITVITLSNFHCNYKNFKWNVISKIKNKKMKSLNCFQTFFYLHRTYRNQIRDFFFLSFVKICLFVWLSFFLLSISSFRLSVCLFIFCLFVCLSVSTLGLGFLFNFFLSKFICLYVCLYFINFIFPSVCLFSVCLYVFLYRH